MYVVINGKKYNIVVMNSFFNRLRGLMFRKDKIKSIYMFPRCSSIHTFFMYQAIDVCILDKNFVITHISRSLSRGKILVGRGYYTLEMPCGSCNGLSVGDKIDLKK